VFTPPSKTCSSCWLNILRRPSAGRKASVSDDVFVPEPLWVNHIRKALKKCAALLLDLFREAVMRYPEDIFEFVVSCNGDVAAVGLEIDCSCKAKLYADRR
jgi:hypothetical protein